MASVILSGNTSGTVTLSAPAVAGSTSIVLPALSGNALVDIARSLSTNGYVKMSNGLVIQWGYNAGGSTTTSVTFPIAFPSACLNVQTTINTTNNVNINNRVDSQSTTGFNSWVYGAHAYNWFALGY